jgi:hypothetical protein
MLRYQPSLPIAVNDAGNAFVASQLDGDGVQLDRLAAGATAFDTPRAIDPAGTSPIVAALPGASGAAVIFTIGTEGVGHGPSVRAAVAA